ncbi:MAG: hypothetical protein JSV90_08360 [Methanobacteriota archaeon]|nr:MAG: hypothetical protein JSV90_08360 [Euryarchaeota archaeon]
MKVVQSIPSGKTTERWPTLGLLYIASSCLERCSDEIRMIDAFVLDLSEEALVERAMNEEPDVFGVNCSPHKFLDAISAMRSDAAWAQLVLARKARAYASKRSYASGTRGFNRLRLVFVLSP